MAIYLASVNAHQNHHGVMYCTTVKPMIEYEYLWFTTPTWELVGGYKNHQAGGRDARWAKYQPLTEEEYTRKYWALMMSPARKPHWNAWVASLTEDMKLTLVCYCPEGAFCHRKIMAEMIQEWRADLTVILH